jgi:hypothetical protein
MTFARFTSAMTPVLSGVLALFLSLAHTGCGLGTEVGNGAKPGGEEESSKKAGSTANDSEDADTKNGSDGGNEENQVEPGNVGGVPTSEEQDSNSSPLPSAGFDFDVNILLNDCASPFESAFDGKIALGAVTKAGKMSKILGSYDADAGRWVLKDAVGTTLAQVADDGSDADHKVLVTDEQDAPVDSGYTCGEVSGSASGDYYTYSAILTKSGKSARLSWRVLTGGPKDILDSITVTPDVSSTAQVKLSTVAE